MKYTFLLFSISLLFLQCKTSSNLKDTPSITTVEPGGSYIQDWISGVKGGGYGYNVFISSASDVQSSPQYIVCRNQIVIPERSSSHLIGRFLTSNSFSNYDYQLTNLDLSNSVYMDLKDLITNSNLSKNDVLLITIVKDTLLVRRMNNVKEKALLAYPQVRPRN